MHELLGRLSTYGRAVKRVKSIRDKKEGKRYLKGGLNERKFLTKLPPIP